MDHTGIHPSLTQPPTAAGKRVRAFFAELRRDLARNKYKYAMLLPVIAFYVLFRYGPITKMIIAFQDYNLFRGISGSKFVGMANFIKFFQLKDCWRLIRNTLMLSMYSVLFAFPAPILLALMINEVRSSNMKRTIQTISYMPHFISLVVVCGMLRNFASSGGIFNQIIRMFNPNWSSPNLLGVSAYYRAIHIASSVWQEVGWGSIIYLATLSTIDPQLYEAAYIDGASKPRRILHVTLPALVPIIVAQFIMRLGSVMGVNSEKILLLYSPLTYETSDVMATYLYRDGLLNGKYSSGAAIGIFNSLISIVILVSVNKIFRRLTEESLW
ncbi:sugar ABC transporter permease [Clostridia bacterium]|nr:sugar ABC transporter permease [Clostridia bacterium]